MLGAGGLGLRLALAFPLRTPHRTRRRGGETAENECSQRQNQGAARGTLRSVCVRQTRPLVFLDTRPKRGWATDLCASRAGPVRPDHRLQSRRGFTSGQNSGEG